MEAVADTPAAPSSIPQLPGDVLQHIFTIGGSATALEHSGIHLDQRLRCLLVCKAWRAVLDPRTLPVPLLELVLGLSAYKAPAEEESLPRMLALAEWVRRVQPAVQGVQLELRCLPPTAPHIQLAHDALLSLRPRTVTTGTNALVNCAWLAVARPSHRRALLNAGAQCPQH